jgi:hypothetical protein
VQTFAAIVVFVLALGLIPLAGYAATDSWRGAWQATRQYVLIVLAIVAAGGGVGLLSVAHEHGAGFIWRAITGR